MRSQPLYYQNHGIQVGAPVKFSVSTYVLPTGKKTHDFQRTIQRYKDSNLKADRFMLYVRSGCETALNELILGSLYLGVSDFNLKSLYWSCVVPSQVFGNTSLVKLSLDGCVINKRVIIRSVIPTNLISISLYRVWIEDDKFRDIISACPLVEYFVVFRCVRLTVINVSSMRNLKSLSVCQKPCEVDLGEPGIMFPNLSCLNLENVDVSFDGLSSKCPCLEDLTVRRCTGYSAWCISSYSVKRLSLTVNSSMFGIVLNVPNIVKFKCDGDIIPSLSFTSTTSNNWESDITFSNSLKGFASIVFIKLRQFLRALRQSRINLHLTCYMGKGESPPEDNYPRGQLPVVENLILNKIYPSSEYCAFVECLFSTCRPKLIIEHSNDSESGKYSFLQVLYKMLREHLDSMPYSCCLNGLWEVNAEFVGNSPMERQLIFCEGYLSRELGCFKDGKDVRFRLSWK